MLNEGKAYPHEIARQLIYEPGKYIFSPALQSIAPRLVTC